MRIMIDTNILFSALLFPNSKPSKALFHITFNQGGRKRISDGSPVNPPVSTRITGVLLSMYFSRDLIRLSASFFSCSEPCSISAVKALDRAILWDAMLFYLGLEAWHKLKLKEIVFVLGIDELLFVIVLDDAFADVFVKLCIGKAEVFFVGFAA